MLDRQWLEKQGVASPATALQSRQNPLRPDAKIIIVEGEKCADAAALIFPDFIATTSSSGAQSAARTDWMPLAGRRVLIWPDNDEAGLLYGSDVAAILAALGCDVSTIDAAALAAIGPKGGAREPAEGYDAADAIEEWPDLEALADVAAGVAQPFHGGPAYVSFGPYMMDADGLTLEKEVGRGNAKRTETIWISAAFEVLGECRDPRGRAWGKMLRWCDPDGRAHTHHVPDADLHGEPSALCAKLADIGLRVDPDGQRALVRYLWAVRVNGRVTVVQRTGWQQIGGHPVFVLPDETIAPRGGEPVILDATVHGPYETRGSLEDWRNGPARLAGGHALPMLAISAALAGPLLGLAGMEGGGVHFFGQSSTGKTTLLALGASVWGRGDIPGYVRTWRATANGLEGSAAGATDTVLILDEVGQVEAREMAAALYTHSPTVPAKRGRTATDRFANFANGACRRYRAARCRLTRSSLRIADEKFEQAKWCGCWTSPPHARLALSIKPGRTAMRQLSLRSASVPPHPPMAQPGENLCAVWFRKRSVAMTCDPWSRTSS